MVAPQVALMNVTQGEDVHRFEKDILNQPAGHGVQDPSMQQDGTDVYCAARVGLWCCPSQWKAREIELILDAFLR